MYFLNITRVLNKFKKVKIKDNNALRISFFIIILFIGGSVYKDYGIAGDEIFLQWIGQLNFSNLIEILNFNFENDYKSKLIELSKDKGLFYWLNFSFFFEFISNIIKNLFSLNYSREIFFFIFFINFFFFFLSSIYFFFLINKRFEEKKFSYLAVTLLYLCPRIFAESFFNTKDIVFLSFFIITIYYYFQLIKKKNTKNLIIFSIVSGILISQRIIGILIPLMVFILFLFENIDKKKKLKKIFLYVFFSLLIISFVFFLLMPILWFNVLINIKNYIHHQKIIIQGAIYLVEYYGEYIPSITSPWNYRLLWITITIPEVLVIISFVGFFYLSIFIYKKLIKLEKKKKLWDDNNELLDTFIFSLSLVITLLLVFTWNKYNGWRHFYFSYCLIIYLGFFFLENIKKKIFLRNIIIFFLIINIFKNIFWMIINHPHQHTYLNYYEKIFINKRFELDYYGSSLRDDIEYVLRNDQRPTINIISIGQTYLPGASKILKEEQFKRLKFDNIKNPDYIINNYHLRFGKTETIDLEKYTKFRDLIVDNKLVSTIYKKK